MAILDDLRAAIEQTKPIVYYSTSDQVLSGKALRIAAQGMHPDHWVFHPDDFETKRAELAQVARLVHMRDWKPTPAQCEQEEAAIWRDLGEWARKETEKRLEQYEPIGIRPRWQR